MNEHGDDTASAEVASRPFSEITLPDGWGTGDFGPDWQGEPWVLHFAALERPFRAGQPQRIKIKCERCGFKPEHRSQLDIHNHRGELHEQEVLCANCHRLQTARERGWL